MVDHSISGIIHALRLARSPSRYVRCGDCILVNIGDSIDTNIVEAKVVEVDASAQKVKVEYIDKSSDWGHMVQRWIQANPAWEVLP